MQLTLISRAKKKIWPKNRCEYDQEITVAETEKVIKPFENDKSPGKDGLPAEFCQTFNGIPLTDLQKLYIEISQHVKTCHTLSYNRAVIMFFWCFSERFSPMGPLNVCF